MNEQIPVDLLFIFISGEYMTDSNRRKRFEEAGFFYLKDKEMLAELEKAYPDLKDIVLSDEQFTVELEEKHGRGGRELYCFLKENTAFVEEVLEQTERLAGREGRDILYYLCVERHTQQETADHFMISRRSLQYRIFQWFERMSEDE